MSIASAMLLAAATTFLAAGVEPDYVQRFRKYVAGLQSASGEKAQQTNADSQRLMRILGPGKVGPPPKGEISEDGPGWKIVGGVAYFESVQAKINTMRQLTESASKSGLAKTMSKKEIMVPKYTTIDEPPQGSFGRFDQAVRIRNEGGKVVQTVPRLVVVKEIKNDEVLARYEMRTFHGSINGNPVEVVASPPMLIRGVPANRAGGRVLGVCIFEVSGTQRVADERRKMVNVPVLINRDIERYIMDELTRKPEKKKSSVKK